MALEVQQPSDELGSKSPLRDPEAPNCLRFALPAEAIWWLGGLEGKVGEVKV